MVRRTLRNPRGAMNLRASQIAVLRAAADLSALGPVLQRDIACVFDLHQQSVQRTCARLASLGLMRDNAPTEAGVAVLGGSASAVPVESVAAWLRSSGRVGERLAVMFVARFA